MKNSKTLKLFLASTVILAVGAGIVVAKLPGALKLASGDTDDHQIVMSSSKNRVNTASESKSDTTTLKTKEDNDVGFQYGNLKGSANGWQVMTDTSSYIKNTDPINGLYSIKVRLEEKMECCLILTWSDTSDFKSSNDSYLVFDPDLSWIEHETPLFMDSPAYFKLEVDEGSNIPIESITINYSCIAKE